VCVCFYVYVCVCLHVRAREHKYVLAPMFRCKKHELQTAVEQMLLPV
jgi:hypothetical protein